MGTVSNVALLVSGISFVLLVTFFGRLPALRHTPIAWLHRLVWIRLTNGLLALDRRLTSGRVTPACIRSFHHMMNDKHPTVLIFFLLLLSVSEYLFLPPAWPQISWTHRIITVITTMLPYLFLYLAAFTDPGFITPLNHADEMSRYPYDFALFRPGNTCVTCKLLKPARSKHCSVCKRCIGRHDHHCIFINNCVGAANHRWFLLLLLTSGILTLYGGFLGMALILTKMRARFPHWSLLPWQANGGEGMTFKAWLAIWTWGLQGDVGMGSVTLLALLCSPLVWGLLVYHCWLIFCGTTTNESLKWSDWQAEMADGLAFIRKLPDDRQKDLRFEPAWTRWPSEAGQIIVRTDTGEPPSSESAILGIGEWERVWRLRDVENVYDGGVWHNLRDLFSPGLILARRHAPDNKPCRPKKRKGKRR